MPEMMVVEHKDKDVLISAWIEGSGRSAEIISVVQDSIWSVDTYNNNSAPGATNIVMMTCQKTKSRSSTMKLEF